MKIVSVVGARPNFVKLGPVSRSLDDAGYEHIIVHTGQHYDYEMSKIFFTDFGLPIPNVDLGVGSGSACFQIGEMTEKRLEHVLMEGILTWCLFMETLIRHSAGAICANKCNIKLGHIEAGLRSYDRAMPEENNRS